MMRTAFPLTCIPRNLDCWQLTLDSNSLTGVPHVQTTRFGARGSSSSIVEMPITSIPILKLLICRKLVYCVPDHRRTESDGTRWTLETLNTLGKFIVYTLHNMPSKQ